MSMSWCVSRVLSIVLSTDRDSTHTHTHAHTLTHAHTHSHTHKQLSARCGCRVVTINFNPTIVSFTEEHQPARKAEKAAQQRETLKKKKIVHNTPL